MVALSPPLARRPRPGPALTLALAALVVLASILSLTSGAAGLGAGKLIAALMGEGPSPRDRVVLFDIRLPRLAPGLLGGAALAVSGALLEGLFRNPLADPGIVWIGAGASFGAILAIVLGGALPPALALSLGPALVPVAAFLGGWAAMLALYRIATTQGCTDVATMLLAGIAMAALAGAATGVLVTLADDRHGPPEAVMTQDLLELPTAAASPSTASPPKAPGFCRRPANRPDPCGAFTVEFPPARLTKCRKTASRPARHPSRSCARHSRRRPASPLSSSPASTSPR